MKSTTEKPKVKLIGKSSNAFAIMGACRKAALKAGWTMGEWNVVMNEMTAGDYNQLLGVAMKHFEVS